ncbi:coiled-coil domain-containing glutamate-rich protein 2 [Carettochelys insculpta]|uniref:coiled-coil domain-containing glutamate-rich protein 2 n=1 Tax=Carettochelys insculpta TaxID=44489 RepID=UPI003EBB2A32
MLALGLFVLLLSCWRADSLPLPTQLSEEDEKVIKCITEVLADTLAKPSPSPAASNCLKILKEDERVLALLHHHYLLKELKELVHEENPARPPSPGAWSKSEGAELRRREEAPQRQETTTETVEEQEKGGEAREEEYKETEKVEEKVKEEKVSHGADSSQAAEAQETLEEEEEEEERKRGHQEARRVSLKLRDTRGPRSSQITGSPAKRHGSEEASSEAEARYHLGSQRHGGRGGWEEEEEEEEDKRGGPAKRVAEAASDEETAQFKVEEKGVKGSDWQSRHRGPLSRPLGKRQHEEEGKRHGHQEEEEEEEREVEDKERELDTLDEIEHALKKVVEKLQELRSL